jgi:hypothetical protein
MNNRNANNSQIVITEVSLSFLTLKKIKYKTLLIIRKILETSLITRGN